MKIKKAKIKEESKEKKIKEQNGDKPLMLLLQFLKASITSFEFVLFPLNAVKNIKKH